MNQFFVVFLISAITIILLNNLEQESSQNVAFASPNLVDKISGDKGWGVVVVDPETNKVFITNHQSDTVTIFDGRSNSNQGSIQVGSAPYGIGINAQTKMLFIALERNDKLVVVNSTSNDIVTELEIEKPYDIAVNSKTNKVYVTSDNVHTLTIIDAATNEIETSFEIKDPCGVGINEETNLTYVTSESANKVYVIDGLTNEIISDIEVGESPRGVGVNHLKNLIYITNQNSNSLSVIDGKNNQVIETIEVGETPRRVVVMPSSNTVYVSNQASNSLSVVDGETNKIKNTIEVKSPFELAIHPIEEKVYSTYYASKVISIIDISDQKEYFLNSFLFVPILLGIAIVGVYFWFFRYKKKQT